jgi:hypothetical protein
MVVLAEVECRATEAPRRLELQEALAVSVDMYMVEDSSVQTLAP